MLYDHQEATLLDNNNNHTFDPITFNVIEEFDGDDDIVYVNVSVNIEEFPYHLQQKKVAENENDVDLKVMEEKNLDEDAIKQ